MNISHTQLDRCRSNPRAWVQAKAGPDPIFSFGYNQALLLAIHRYHKSGGDAGGASQYLQELIDTHFENETRSDQIQDNFKDYIEWCEQARLVVADSKFRIKLNLGVLLELRGEIHRLDLLAAGYRAVLLGEFPPNWRNQLRMPLLQRATAMRYGRPVDRTEIGVQGLDGNGLEVQNYSLREIGTAEEEFRRLSGVVEGHARNIPGLLP